MRVSVCVPTLSQYERLKQLIVSLQTGSLKPDDIWVIDNGLTFFEGNRLDFTDDFGIKHHYRKYGQNIGCAESWNKFLQMTTDIRIISNDDILFSADSLKLLVESFSPDQLSSPANIVGGNAFSCFLLPQKIVETVGYFDEDISPHYCYYEDVDYSLRLRRAGFEIRAVEGCFVEHSISSTHKAFDHDQIKEHNEKFGIAETNYVKKWRGMPGHEER